MIMAFGDKILKFMFNDSSPTFTKKYTYEELSLNCKISKEDILPMLRHLANIGYIATRNKKGWVGNLDIEDKEISLSSKGIQYLEEKTSEKIFLTKNRKFWIMLIVVIIAIIVSIYIWQNPIAPPENLEANVKIVKLERFDENKARFNYENIGNIETTFIGIRIHLDVELFSEEVFNQPESVLIEVGNAIPNFPRQFLLRNDAVEEYFINSDNTKEPFYFGIQLEYEYDGGSRVYGIIDSYNPEFKKFSREYEWP